METLKAAIGKVDDDYLTGLCNKGTVKRAYKDLEQENPTLVWQGEEAQVALKEETCVIRMPLGESGCSCPSRSICRHIVTAILWMKKELAEEEAHTQKQVFNELLNLPTERMKRACGSRYRQLLAHMRTEGLPTIEESSIVLVTLPWENISVKLLEPFAYSTCGCHSKELCVHKAQAVLAYQVKKGRITLEELESLAEAETVPSLDEKLIKQVCSTICESLCGQMCIGLSRQSPEISESMERLAVIAHRAGLPDLESGLRECSAYYEQYFSRSAAFRNEVLLQKILALFRKAQALAQTEDQEKIRKLAGTFRDTYEPAGNLHLVGMGSRFFSSKSGYEGEIYYFLEVEKREWFTWTDARPVFYEGSRIKRPAGSENALAPWELNCSREQLESLEFLLRNAKTAPGGRLSVSQETKGEILGSRKPEMEEVAQMIVWDYEKLLAHCFENSVGRREKLALAGAVRWDETSFDTVRQRFSWRMYDRDGRQLFISLKYTKEERLLINLLERLEQRLRRRQQESIVCFGSPYIDEDGRLCLYPIEFFFREGGLQEENPAGTDIIGNKVSSAEVIYPLEQYCKEALRQLSDLFVSGLDSLQEETLHTLKNFAKEGESLGLHQAGAGFAAIGDSLQSRRHRMEFAPEPVLAAIGKLEAYLRACEKKISYDRAVLSMRKEYQE